MFCDKAEKIFAWEAEKSVMRLDLDLRSSVISHNSQIASQPESFSARIPASQAIQGSTEGRFLKLGRTY